MKNSVKAIALILVLVAALGVLFIPSKAFAANAQDVVVATNENDVMISKAMAAALVVGVVASVGAIAMGIAIFKSAEGVARQPEAAGKIQTLMMLGMVFIETAIIYALIVVIFIIFVL